MKNMQRRDLLKGLGAISAAALAGQVACNGHETQQNSQPSASTPAQAATASPRLNVILHGMFAIVLDTTAKTVKLQAPYVDDHIYLAATPDVVNSGGTPDIVWRQMRWISKAEQVQVNAPSSAGKYVAPPPNALPTDRAMINWKLSKITGPCNASYCDISLPWPDEIWPLRSDVKTKLSGQTYDYNNLAVTKLPTVYVFTYELQPGNVPTLSDMFGKNQPIQVGSDGVMRLHLFAESPVGGVAMDPNKALRELNKMFTPALDLRLNSVSMTSVPVDPNPGQTGVLSCEERSIAELNIPCSQLSTVATHGPAVATGGHPRNCMSVFITQP